jgi:hybrid cluster-associated redox disulfide protein
MKKGKITADMTFGQVFKMYPEAGKMLKKKFNLACLGCGGAENEPIRLGATAHGLDVEDILRELNELIKS